MPLEFKSGDYNRPCDVCETKRKFSQLAKTWDNFWVCKESVSPGCWYTRQPQDFPPPRIRDLKPVNHPRPIAADVFLTIPAPYTFVWSTDPYTWGQSNETWDAIFTSPIDVTAVWSDGSIWSDPTVYWS